MMEYTVNYKELVKYQVFNNLNDLSAGFFNYLVDLVTENISRGKKFTIALSGGSTPMHIYNYMSVVHKGIRHWEDILIYWGDERCVPPESPESNYGNAWRTILHNVNIPTENINRIRGEEDPVKESIRYSTLLNKLDKSNDTPVFDLVILGLGEDGHTASIFPDQMRLLSSEKLVEVATHPGSGQKRISLTGQVLNQARNILFLATGAKKQQRIYEIFNDKKTAEAYPAYHIRPENGNIVWFMDTEAAAKL